MRLDKNTAIVIIASTAIGFIGDTLIYSLGQSAGGKFKVFVPTGKPLVQLLALGIVSGFIIDMAVKGISDQLKAEEELKLDKLVAEEIARIRKGEVTGKTPSQVVWAVTG